MQVFYLSDDTTLYNLTLRLISNVFSQTSAHSLKLTQYFTNRFMFILCYRDCLFLKVALLLQLQSACFVNSRKLYLLHTTVFYINSSKGTLSKEK